jgi:hypothetical protein
MTRLRDREKLKGDIRPLVVNVMNFSKASDGEPTLLSFDDAKTLFHEFGHALHGLRGGAQDRKTHSIQGKHCAAKVLRPARAVHAGAGFEPATCGLESTADGSEPRRRRAAETLIADIPVAGWAGDSVEQPTTSGRACRS